MLSPDYSTRPNLNYEWCYVLCQWVPRDKTPPEPEPTPDERDYWQQLRDFRRPEL